MKNVIKLSIGIILITVLGVWGCTKNQTSNEITQTQITLGKNACQCPLNYVPECADNCIKDDLMKGNAQQFYTIKWSSCTNNGCAGTTSTVKFCYADPSDCKKLQVEISNPPSCLPCIPNPMCIEGTAYCDGGNAVTVSYTDPVTSTFYTFTFTGDPKVHLCCQNQSTGQNLCCDGDLE